MVDVLLLILLPITLVGSIFAWQWYESKQVKENMAIANPRIHMICGICGSNKDFKYKVEITEDLGHEIHITCGNCASLTGLDEIITNGDNCSINKG